MAANPSERLLQTIESAWANAPAPQAGLDEIAHKMGMDPLRRWAGDLDRYLAGVQRDLDLATVQGLAAGLDAVDTALWRLGAARKSLLALSCLTLGVRTLEPADVHQGGKVIRNPIKKSFQWELHAELLGKKLTELNKTHPIAGELNALLVALAEHPAITLRDEVTHSLAPIQAAPVLCLFELWEVRGDAVRAPDIMGMVWPRRMNEKPGITPDVLWANALGEIGDALGLLNHAVDNLNELIAAVGVVRQPQRLYQDSQTGRVTLDDPRRSAAEAARPTASGGGGSQVLAFSLGVAVGVLTTLTLGRGRHPS